MDYKNEIKNIARNMKGCTWTDVHGEVANSPLLKQDILPLSSNADAHLHNGTEFHDTETKRYYAIFEDVSELVKHRMERKVKGTEGCTFTIETIFHEIDSLFFEPLNFSEANTVLDNIEGCEELQDSDDVVEIIGEFIISRWDRMTESTYTKVEKLAKAQSNHDGKDNHDNYKRLLRREIDRILDAEYYSTNYKNSNINA